MGHCSHDKDGGVEVDLDVRDAVAQSWTEKSVQCPDRLVMVWVGWGLLGGCHACMRYLQNARGGGGEGEGEEEELWQGGEEEEGRYSYAGGESGYSSTRTESSSPHSSTREEGGPASLPSQVKMLENKKHTAGQNA